jgi:hypothetical protein
MLIPSQIIITYVRPSIWLPALELIWGLFTGLLALSKNAQTIYALRFLIGFCEASAYPGTAVLLMSASRCDPNENFGRRVSDRATFPFGAAWYTPLVGLARPLIRRSCIEPALTLSHTNRPSRSSPSGSRSITLPKVRCDDPPSAAPPEG